MLLQTLCHPSFLRLPLGCWQTIKHPLYGKPCRVHFAFGGWERRNERTAARRKIQLPLQAQSEVCSRPKRNKWRGPAAGGEVAVYAGFGLEQTQRSARRVDLTTPTLAIKLSQEPFLPVHLPLIFPSSSSIFFNFLEEIGEDVGKPQLVQPSSPRHAD